MQNFLYYVKKYGKDSLLFVLLLTCIGLLIYNTFIKEENTSNAINTVAFSNLTEKKEEKTEQIVATKFHIDVKGAVKKPGVYEVDNNTIINDVIKLAGGFQPNAYQNGINLSKKVNDEMVIYIYTKSEIQKFQENINQTPKDIEEINTTCKTPDYSICECVNEKQSIIEVGESSTKNDYTSDLNSNETKKVNINTALVPELTTLTGVGESKAQAIIKYREENGNFNKIEDIMNVSGIGEKAFEKIKDFITI